MGDGSGYRLAPLREVRELAERARQGELAAALGDAREAEGRLAAARASTAAARDALARALAARDAEPTALARTRADAYVARLRRGLDACRADELRAEVAASAQHGEVDVARATLARARADREVLERHFARWREQRRRLAERREE